MVLQGAGLALCSVFTLFFGGSPLVYTPSPRGDCPNCCPLREAKDILFKLYTRYNPEVPELLYVSDARRLTRSHYNRSNPLIVYLHGFSERAPGPPGASSYEIRNAFLESGDFNVILVDWSPLTALPWYVNSVKNGPKVARYVARFLRFLFQNGIPIERTHVIGFSLGAEVAGFAGKTLKEWGWFLPRITGLDPAFPLYMFSNNGARLSAGDAKFVDVIHSDGGLLGVPWPLGHADFYPNGGIPLQPGCAKQEIARNRWIGVIIGCSHQRAWQYFVESIKRPSAFLATKCEPNPVVKQTSCETIRKSYMGLYASPRLRGKFYLTTNSEPPYGRGF